MPKVDFDKQGITRQWANIYRDDFGDDKPQYDRKDSSLPLVVKEDIGTGGFFIEGYANTIKIDSENDIILPQAWTDDMAEYMSHGAVFPSHNWWAWSVGRCVDYRIDSKGLWVRDYISEWEEEIRTKIREKILTMLSVGFRIKEYVRGTAGEILTLLESYGVTDRDIVSVLKANIKNERDTEYRLITKAKLFEHSIVNIGANPASTMTPAKSATDEVAIYKSLLKPGAPGILSQRSNDMPDSAVEIKKLEDNYNALTTRMDSLDSTVKTIDEARKTIADIHRTFAELKENKASVADMKAFEQKVEKQLADSTRMLEKINDQLKAVPDQPLFEASSLGQAKRLGFLDGLNQPDSFKGAMIYTEAEKAAGHFGLPSYKGLIEEMQHEHDNLMILGAFFDMFDKSPSEDGKITWKKNPGSLKTFKKYQAMVKEFHRIFGVEKAMDGGTAGEGYEYLPTQMSATLIRDLEMERALIKRIPRFSMPTRSYTWPLKGVDAVPYIVEEATDDLNADAITASTPTTSNITMTAKGMGAGVWTSMDFIEDSIIPVIPYIRETLMKALINGEENAVMNGDDSTTHQDTDDAARSAAWITKIFDGLRYDALNTSGANATIGTTLTYSDLIAILKLAGKYAMQPGVGLFVVPVSAYFKILGLSEFTGYSNFALGMVAQQGILPNAIGHDIVPSYYMREALDTNGVNASSGNDYTGIMFIYPKAYMIGDRRIYTVQREDKIWRQQTALVATQRIDFKKMATSTEKTAVFGYGLAVA